MQFTHSTEVSLVSDLNPKNTDVLLSPWNELTNTVAVQIELLYSQPFANISFHFPLLWSQWPPQYQLKKNTVKHSYKFIV